MEQKEGKERGEEYWRKRGWERKGGIGRKGMREWEGLEDRSEEEKSIV